MTEATLIIKNGCIVTMNSEREIYSDGAIAIREDRIIAVGNNDAITSSYNAPDTIDAGGYMIIPGFIDGHNHPSTYFIGGLADDIDIRHMLQTYFYPYDAYITDEEGYTASTASYIEMLRSGVTCFNDPGGYCPDSVAQAAVDIGIRGIVSRSTRDMCEGLPEKLVEDVDTNLRESERVIKKWNGAADGRIRAWCGVRMPITASDDLLVNIRDLAQQYGVGIHAHASTVDWENKFSESKWGKRTLARYRDLDLLKSNLYTVHMGDVTDEEITWLKKEDVKVAHCCAAASMAGAGIIRGRRIPAIMKGGVTMSLGSDGGYLSGNHDFFRLMYLCASLHREWLDDPAAVGAHKAFEMATIDGARACLWDDEIGSLETGKKADVVLVDRSGPEWNYPNRDPIRNLVYSANHNCVDTVIIDGRVVMKGREIQTIDEEENKANVTETGKKWMERGNIPPVSREAWPIL